MSLTRRMFLERLAGSAGAAMTYEAMVAMGMMAVPARSAEAFSLQGPVAGVRVVVLGGGLAGMSTAYELGKLGYDVTVLEARRRPGGRCHTIRRGTVSEEEGSTDVCTFDEGLYYNPGPMRIPHHHTATLGYCRELGVPVEVFVNDNEAAFLYQTNADKLSGTRLRGREVRSDLSGYTAELLSKAMSAGSLDEAMTPADRDALIEYLGRAGALQQRKYGGSARRGYASPPGAGTSAGTASPPLPLDELLGSKTGLYLQTEYLQQAPMFQVVGGNDRLAAGFASKLKDRIVYGARVTEIRQSSSGVEVVYDQDGVAARAAGSFGVCAMPLNMVASLPVVDLAPDLKAAMAALVYSSTGKIGLQFRRRFWEEDDGIFGGISRTDQEIAQIVYPSSGYLGQKGVLVGYYQSGPRAGEMAARPHAVRQALALAQGQKLHPQYASDFEASFSVSWQNVTFNKGGWVQWSPAARTSAYPKLLEPDRRMYFAGDHCSHLTAWMAGALESGRATAKALHVRAAQDAPQTAVA